MRRMALTQAHLTAILFVSICLVCVIGLGEEGDTQYHVVQKSETLGAIAKQHGVDVPTLVTLNQLDMPDRIFPGQKLVVMDLSKSSADPLNNPSEESLPEWTEVIVQPRETLSFLARKHGIPLTELAELNGLVAPFEIYEGQTLKVPKVKEKTVSKEEEQPDPLSLADTKPKQVVVAQGESLGLIAKKYGVQVSDLARINLISKPFIIYPGQTLILPPTNGATISMPDVEYEVRKNQTLSEIASRFGLSIAEVSDYNGLGTPDQIYTGQILLIPGNVSGPIDYALPRNTLDQLKQITPNKTRWKHIVIHHSGTERDSPASMDRWHRTNNKMENGLAYHFVIGNGYRGMKDGEIFIGDRWKRQIQGGHLAIQSLNDNSIGICLIGNFQENSGPSSDQLNSLRELIKYLMGECGVPLSGVQTHKIIHPKHTECPGAHFPYKNFMARLKIEMGR